MNLNRQMSSTDIQLSVLQKSWKYFCLYAWIIFIIYEVFIELDYQYSKSPICPYSHDSYPAMYWNSMYFILGGFVMILANIVTRFFTTNKEDFNKRFLYWIAFHMIFISSISTALTIIFNFGGVCIDHLNVASSASVWGEWIACGPILIFTTIGLVKQTSISVEDTFLILSFVLSLIGGFLLNIASFYVGIFILVVSVLLSFPTMLIFFYHTSDSGSENVNLFKQYRNITTCITILFPCYVVNYLISTASLIDYYQTIIIYQALSLLTKGLFVSFMMDIHLNVLVDIDKALLREKYANETRRSFMKYIFHEVRTPLNSFSIGVDYLRENYASQNSHEIAHTLAAMHSSCLYMSETLNNVLNLHKIEEHKWDVEHTAFSFKEIAQGVETTFRSVILEKKITFITHLIDDIIISDRIKLHHLVTNLVSNAIKFTKQNGCVTLKVTKEGSDLIISVKDNGCGISSENQKKLFMNYSQILPSMLQEGGGSGLGLMFCKNIALLLDGDVYIKSSIPDIGTVFECKIPARFKPPIAISSTVSSVTLQTIFSQHDDTKNDEPIRALVVDDHEASRNIFVMYLKRIGIDTICYAENGAVGFKMVSANLNQFNLLIVDNLMPIMNGVEMTRQLRRLGYSQLIIGLTGNVMEQDMKEFLDAGADYVLMKPLKIKDLKSLIDFIKKYGTVSRTSPLTKLVKTDDAFNWINVTPK